jgi:hypothetical protein
MECASHHASVAERRDPFHHLASGLIRERDQQDLVRRNRTGFYGVGRPPADDPGLARARPGDDRQRSGGGRDRLALGGVQVFKQTLCRCGDGQR